MDKKTFKLYRYDRDFSNVEYGEPIRLREFEVIKSTECGHWINVLGDKKFVLKGLGKRFAYETKYDALNSFILRSQKCHRLEKAKLDRTNICLVTAENMYNKQKREFKAIIARNNLGYIGLDGKLPWNCKADLDHFREMTNGCILLAGFNTAKSLPELKGRKIIVDDRNTFINTSDVDWCIGGAKTYEKYCHLFTELYISNINDNTVGDTMFPTLKNLNPNCKIKYFDFEPDKK